MSNARNHALDLLKFFFILIVVIHHSHIMDGQLIRGYLSVDFFFFVAGYFMCSMAEGGRTTQRYVQRRIYSLYPAYFVAWLILFVAEFATRNLTYKCWYSPILELLMLQNVGIPGGGGINYPLWYISVLMWGGTIIYILKRKLPHWAFNLFGALLVLATYGYLIVMVGGIEYWSSVGGVFYVPLLRGMSDITIGMWIYDCPKMTSVKLADVIQLGSLVMVMAGMCLHNMGDFVVLPLIAVLMWSSTCANTMLDRIGARKPFIGLYQYQYYIYVGHALAIMIWNYVMKLGAFSYLIRWIVLFVLLVVTTLAIKKLTELLRQVLASKWIQSHLRGE
ncbi:acyltransferase family protein [Pseudoscardovia suis]|uniref:acyltransferase family protein n=1 Tax=Pseudoscardovia suis TaxID=987063 RepID=UPI003F9BE906